MKKTILMTILLIFSLIIVTELISCSSGNQRTINRQETKTPPAVTPSTPETTKGEGTFAEEITAYGKPVLVDFGMESCVPCKMMVPVLEDLETHYQQDLQVIFVHVGKEQGKTKEFGIQMIPTQIFFDAAGKELERHTGFISKEDILHTFQKYNVQITK